jgi:hypothetical protein
MPTKYFKIDISDNVEIHVWFETVNGVIVSFVVKLIFKVGSDYHEVVRFDSAHECPHKDILDITGTVKRKVWFEFLDNKQGLDLAIKDLKDNFELYIERYKKWLKK